MQGQGQGPGAISPPYLATQRAKETTFALVITFPRFAYRMGLGLVQRDHDIADMLARCNPSPFKEKTMGTHLTEVLLSRKQVQEACSIGRSTLWQRIKEGTFPAPIRTGKRDRRWSVSSINAHIAQQIEQSRTRSV